MKKIVILLLVISGAHTGTGTSEATGGSADVPVPAFEVLADPHFLAGFRIIDPSTRKVCKRVKSAEEGPEPAWAIAQWNTRFNLADTLERRRLPNGGVLFEDDTKYLEFHHEDGMLVLGLDSMKEYEGKFRDATQGWPHLLVQQTLKTPFLDQLKSLTLSLEACILAAENIEDPAKGYNPGLHASQFQIFLIVKDDKPDSPGRHDFYWHGVPVYDSRKPFHEESLHVDFNPDMPQANRRSIYVPATSEYLRENGDRHVSAPVGHSACANPRFLTSQEPPTPTRWVRFEADLLPLIQRGLTKAKAKGALAHSRGTLDAYRITHINIGWEMPGLANAKGAIRGLSLLGEPQ